jgi:hypothetical protein
MELRNEEERNFVTGIVPELVWIMKMAIEDTSIEIEPVASESKTGPGPSNLMS